jgi:hypothetical protein
MKLPLLLSFAGSVLNAPVSADHPPANQNASPAAGAV